MKLKIDKPCHENWDEMSLKAKGRHCKACDKLVLDMTKYSDTQIIEFFKKKRYDVCGQFDDTQIDRELVPNIERKSISIRKQLVAATIAGTLLGSANAQPNSAETNIELHLKGINLDSQNSEVNNNDETVLFLIQGKVIDEDGQPISGASVKIGEEEILTDKNGAYELNYGVYETESLDVTVYISVVGMQTKTILLNLNFDQTSVDMGTIEMSEIVRQLKGKVRIKG